LLYYIENKGSYSLKHIYRKQEIVYTELACRNTNRRCEVCSMSM